MGLPAPYSLRLVVALGQWDEKQGGPENREQRGPSICLELWVHCLVVCERPACVAGGRLPQPPAQTPPQTPVKLWPLPISCSSCPLSLSCLYSRTLAHTLTRVFSPCPPRPPPPGLAALALPALSLLLSPVLFAFSPTASRSGQASPSRPESPRPPFDL